VQSFWTKPILENSNYKHRSDRLKGGWINHTSHLMSWALSSLQLRRYYDDLVLVTDDFGKELLIGLLNLPYTDVRTDLNQLSTFHPDLWALGKIYSYGVQNMPFIHIDGDVFVYEKFKSKFENSPLVCQNLDIDLGDYIRILKKMDNYKFEFPDQIKNIRKNLPNLIASNAGIIGGTRVSFFKEYSKIAFDFINNNLSRVPETEISSFNIIFEQYFYYCLARYKNLEIIPYFKSPEMGESLSRNVSFYNAPFRSKYIHMMAFFKQNSFLVDQMQAMLRIHHTDYFYKIKGITENTIFRL
jgi:hypothetical protein